MSPEQRKQTIVEATLAVAGRKGLGATTVRDVAAEMGSSSGLIHHYFETMDHVLAAAFELAAGGDLDQARETVSRQKTATAKLAAFLAGYSPSQNDSTMQLWLDAWSEAARRPVLQDVSRRLNLEWQAMLAGIITEGVKAGGFECNDPGAAAWRILSILDGLALQVVAHGSVVTRSDAVAWSATAAETELALVAGVLTGDPAIATAG